MKKIVISIAFTIAAIAGTYNLWNNVSVLIFISILILSFLLSYKFTDYIVDFNTLEHHSLADIIFAIIILCILFVPVSNIDNQKKSKLEKRMLAKAPVLVKKHKLNLSYGKEFNAWFNDRFCGRKKFIQVHTALTCMININNCKIGKSTFDKKHNLIYREFNFWGMAPIKKQKAKTLKLYANNLNRFEKYCDENGIALYVLLVPRQADFFDFDMADKRKRESNPADEVIDYLNRNTKTPMIYPIEEMQEANKETPVYFKTDHHWTKKGAYIGYRALMAEVQKDFPSIPVLDETSLEKYYNKKVSEWWNQEFNNGQTYKQMGLPKFYAKRVLDTNYLYYKNPYKKNLKQVKSKFVSKRHDVQFYYPNGAKENILVIGDSFGCNLFEFMPYSFQNSLYLYNNPRGFKFKNYKDTIENYKPDILVLLFYTPNIPKFADLYSDKQDEKESK